MACVNNPEDISQVLHSEAGTEFKEKRKTDIKKDTVIKVVDNESSDEEDHTPSIEELLKIPDHLEDGGRTMDEVLDQLDIQIEMRKRKHEEEMAKIDSGIFAEKRRQGARLGRLKTNAVRRDRLEVEITESRLRTMFEENREYLQKIKDGKIDSARHKAFHQSTRTRHALFYSRITHPFSQDQVDWTLDEISKVKQVKLVKK